MKKRIDNIEAAKLFVENHYSKCDLAILTGSTVTKEDTLTSDLDIIIISNEIGKCYRKSVIENDWPIESFVHTLETCKKWIDKDVLRRKPSMPNMIIEGEMIKGSELHFNELKQYSYEKIKNGPAQFNDEEDRNERYLITDLLDDLIGSNNHYDDIFILNELLDKVINYQLVKSGKWIAHTKRIRKALISIDKELAEEYFIALSEFYKMQNKNQIITLIENVLEKNGGRLFAGYLI